ncbi:hypothetical protein [Dictyobacter kobayashii]|uniref:DUF4352 domain-containing protein n=1 Tax=Dictyobacter kobayashii TaxID=2014872 RepID=A0A402AR55_9CHLR|nr:hypothetical protein [Dictyobacter kobayashii]GCE21572.1 hypothetical protein KDK_53720 [Dictyobacter kobayashii]
MQSQHTGEKEIYKQDTVQSIPEQRYSVSGPSKGERRFRAFSVSMLVVALGLCLCAVTVVGTPIWLLYQLQRGLTYGYISIDDPRMTHPQHVGDTVADSGIQLTLVSIHHAQDDKGKTFLVVHARFQLDPNNSQADRYDPGTFVVYSSPVLQGHQYRGQAIQPVDDNGPVPAYYADTRLKLAQLTIQEGESKEGDILFSVPADHGPLELVWMPPATGSEEQFAWDIHANTCLLVKLDLC